MIELEETGGVNMGKRNVQEIRPAAVAGKYYPADAGFLSRSVDKFLGVDEPVEKPGEIPKAIIAPHSGYIYSGAVAGKAFRPWIHAQVQRVVIMGPSHFYDFPGIALPDTSVFVTPLGELEVDPNSLEVLRRFSFVHVFEAPHEGEHTIEVELPFVQRLFPEVKIVPLVTGTTNVEHVSRVLEKLWGGPETLIIVSSDLSHYYDYATAQRVDASTAQMIENLDFLQLTGDQACGYQSIRGLLKTALKREMRCEVQDVRNSGDTSSDSKEVTGFGAFHFFEL